MRVDHLTRTDAELSLRVQAGEWYQHTPLDIGLAFASSGVEERVAAHVVEWSDCGGGFELDLRRGSIVLWSLGEVEQPSGVVPELPFRVDFDLHGVHHDVPFSCLGSILVTGDTSRPSGE